MLNKIIDTVKNPESKPMKIYKHSSRFITKHLYLSFLILLVSKLFIVPTLDWIVVFYPIIVIGGIIAFLFLIALIFAIVFTIMGGDPDELDVKQ